MLAYAPNDHYFQRRAAFHMSVVGDPEDSIPSFRMPPMSDQDDREHTETLAPPTDREATTNPDNERPEPRAAIHPPPPLAAASRGDSYFAEAARDFASALVEMRETRQEISEGFKDHGGKLDEMAHEFAANYGLLAGEFKSFRGVVEARLDDGERRFDAIEMRLEDLKKDQLLAAQRQLEAAEKIASLEAELKELKANVPARQAPTPG